MLRTAAVTVICATSLVVGGDRDGAVKFTEEQAKEHAELFCSRAALVEIRVEPEGPLQLCGSSSDHALMELADVVDLFARMNSEALRDGWVFFGPTHGKTVVFKLRRNEAGSYEAPPVAFVADHTAAPLDQGADAVREWLADQDSLAGSPVSARGGAIISWGPLERK